MAKRSLLAVCLLPLAGCTGVFFHPDRHVYQAPEAVGLPFETPTFQSLDGTKLTGIYFPATTQPALGTVVHFHGNGANITAQWGYSSWLASKGFNVFVLDYRGYGASEGRPTEHGAVLDGIAALRWVRARRDVDPEKLVVLGQSLGAAVALASVARSTEGVRAIALEAPFSSYRSIAREKLSLFWLTNLLKWPLSWLLISDRDKPLDALASLPPVPLLVMHAPLDPVVPYSEGFELYEAAREPKLLWITPGEGHCEALTRFGGTYRPKLVEFFTSALR